MEYEIIATLGPGSADAATWQAMLSAGASAFRLNTSHLSLEQLQTWLEKLDTFRATLDSDLALVLDLQGSKWRIGGHFTPFELIQGQVIELVMAASTDRPLALPVPHADFFRAAELSSGEILLNDAKIRLQMESGASVESDASVESGASVEAGSADRLRARVIQGGRISPNKGITFGASEYRSESLSEKDRSILEQTGRGRTIRYAISYVKDAAEMARYRALADGILGRPATLIAKLERGPAMAEAERIAGSADELWVCRGDLGAELGMQEMAETVHRFSISLSDGKHRFNVPVMLAGQVLEHMTGQPSPTRSEVCYLYDSLARGYQGVVLSDETAIGMYPVESCRTAALFKTHETGRSGLGGLLKS